MNNLNLYEFLIEFTNKGRYQIFKSLYIGNKKHSDLEKELSILGPEISRNLKRLLKKDLIKKTMDARYEITETGKIFYHALDVLGFTIKYKDFFNSHEISSIPIDLYFQLGILKDIRSNNITMENVQSWSDLVKNSENFVFAISDQFQDSILPIIERKMGHQTIDMKVLISEHILSESVDVGKKLENRHAFYDKLNVFENVRIIKEPKLSLIASDKGSILFFSKEGIIDYSYCLLGEQIAFINWTVNLFEWYWKKGKDLKAFIKNKKIL